MRNYTTTMLIAACMAAMPICSQAGTITFAEYDGAYGDNSTIPADQLPQGLPDGITASWTGFFLHTRSGDTPMSIFPTDDLPGDDALIRFSGPVLVPSINTFANTGGGSMSIKATRWGAEVWRYSSAGNDIWQKVTVGAGKEIDTLIFEGRWNHHDDIEVEAAPDTDGDGYTDADETATGHNPNDPDDNPTTKAIADSVVQFTTTGIQGENDQYYGYRNLTIDGGGESYDPATGFIEFPPEAWTGGGWALGGNPPWTNLGQRDLHPNTGANAVHWVIRRWVANQLTKVTPLAIRWHTRHSNAACGGNGITGALYNNGRLLDKAVIAAPDSTGITHTYYINVAPGDRIDLILSPKGTDGVDNDGCDGSQNWFLVDPTIPADPHQPDGSIFVPIGSGDTDGDGLADVWEKIYFPGDLTKLSGAGDFDKDGLTDLGEYERSSDPTKTDTDSDGLTDLVETGTGLYASKTDTGSSPSKADTDGDGISDSAEVNRTPPTNPNKADTDADGYSDADEIAAGSNPVDLNDTPVTFVIANSQAEFSGVQGQNGWYNGYHNFNPIDGTVDYDPNQGFIPYPGGEGLGGWDGTSQTWDGGAWDLNQAGDGPWTFQGSLSVHPNGTNSAPTVGGTADPTIEHWPIRRWVATELTTTAPMTIIWKVRKANTANQGVTGLLLINGHLADSKSIYGNDGVGETRRFRTTLKKTDIVDLALSPANPDGDRHDWSDASETWFWVDARPLPPADIQISSPAMNAAEGKFTFKWNSQPGAKYSVLISTDMNTWTPHLVVDSGGIETTFSDILGSSQPSVRFYRVTLL